MDINITIEINESIIRFCKKVFTVKTMIFLTGVCLFISGLVIFSQQVTKPYTFREGEVISSSEVNKNFDILYTLVNKNFPASSVLQTRIYSDYTRRITAEENYYYFGGSEFENSITPTTNDNIILISINYFGESNSHNGTIRLQYSINSGYWNDFDLTGFGQQGTLKIGAYPDTNYESTPHNFSTQVAKVFYTTSPISFRMYHFNGGTFYHNSSVNSLYESAPSTLVLQELNTQNSSYVKR